MCRTTDVQTTWLDLTEQAFPCHSLPKLGLVQGHAKHQQKKEMMLFPSYYLPVGAVPPPSPGDICAAIAFLSYNCLIGKVQTYSHIQVCVVKAGGDGRFC